MAFFEKIFKKVVKEQENKFVPNFNKTEYDNWLEFLSQGGTTEKWNRLIKENKWEFSLKKRDNKQIIGENNISSYECVSSQNSYVDATMISEDEKSYYQEDSYYTYYSNPGTLMERKVVTFEERKRISYPSLGGLYVAEILLLEYCSYGNYPKPDRGYPGFWWFKYGIRDIGHALESLEKRGFIKWSSPINNLQKFKVSELKQILISAGLSDRGKKVDLIDRIVNNISEEHVVLPSYIPKYELTIIGEKELNENGYVPYMHKHDKSTIEGVKNEFNVWMVNKLFKDGNASNWRNVVGNIEKQYFGVAVANALLPSSENHNMPVTDVEKNEMREYLRSKYNDIQNGIQKDGDGLKEELKGIDLKKIGKDKEALFQFYIAIGKNFDAPALYRETCILLRKYHLYEEELSVIKLGLQNIPEKNLLRETLIKRKEKVENLIEKENLN